MKLIWSCSMGAIICRILVYSPLLCFLITCFEVLNLPIIIFGLIGSYLMYLMSSSVLGFILFTRKCLFVPSELRFIKKIQEQIKIKYDDIIMIEYCTYVGENYRGINVGSGDVYFAFDYLIVTLKNGRYKHIAIQKFSKRQVRKIEKIIIKKSPNVIVKIKYDDFISGAWAK